MKVLFFDATVSDHVVYRQVDLSDLPIITGLEDILVAWDRDVAPSLPFEETPSTLGPLAESAIGRLGIDRHEAFFRFQLARKLSSHDQKVELFVGDSEKRFAEFDGKEWTFNP